ncbi:chromosome segregation protein SMC [Acidocella sp. KAb 2-4]|uniref:chromosome segregation protein SMC n=1 Tax=Acidocella sp. KAb 2-4 TaxID=2885158 RepID=UPI001D093ABF|nr:chromosome segregation protein SMC [Acidocella sp. KAb 2-4]MCB5943616.1 chromosome segregation protein SMC [Acidocella sp. KAb 2-4]
MPARFARLRIAGFKSFADPTTVEILPGLTGVVGPNGCGKSNVIEALRWAMGEANARNMRGNEMEDVIFAGTAGRTARNLAEVTLTLEDTLGLAPPPFHEAPDLEVSRKIERGSGSSYRVNGKEARARDVQTLFADLASGARASAMVSQGRVSALVNARPDERRALLEEAAGITGLHARRHEAELKLKAAEQNLLRADDLKGQVEARLAELKKQARQATRYKNLSGNIRQAEAELLAIQSALAVRAREQAEAAFAAAEAQVAEAAAEAQAAEARAAEAGTALPPLREAEAAARTALERARIAAEQMEEAESRARAALAEAKSRLDTLSRDHAHAAKLVTDAEAAAARLREEQQRLTAEAEAAPAALDEAGEAEAGALEALRAAEAETNRATEDAARIAAEAEAARRALSEAESRARRQALRAAETETEYQKLAATLIPAERVQAAEAERAEAETALAAAREAVTAAEAARAQAEEEAAAARAAAEAALAAARTQTAGAESAATKIATEYDALAALLAQKFGRESAPILDQISVPPGLEAALGAALREELSASADNAAPRHWRKLPDLPAPETALPSFDRLVQGPEQLTRALSHILLLPQDADGEAHQASLTPGQILVSREGAVWRWDGYTVRAGAASEAAVRLKQRNRLAALERERDATRAAAAAAREQRQAAEAAEREARANEAKLREARRAAEAAAREARRQAEIRFDKARNEAIRLTAEHERGASRAAAAQTQRDQAAAEAAEAAAALRAAQESAAGLPDVTAARAAVDKARAAMAQARQEEAAARGKFAALKAAEAQRQLRLTSLTREMADWAERGRDAKDRLTDLAARLAEAETSIAALAAAPEAAASAKREARESLTAAEAEHKRNAAALHSAQTAAETASRTARAAEAALSAAREARAREEGNITAANHAWGTVAERILERLGASPTLPEPPEELSPETEDKARKRWERLAREREEMGPVNLRAEIEVGEAEEAIATIEKERAEITSAIAKLRGSIGHLNREGRERLSAVFNEVDKHFQELFARMFNGGKAHLALVGSEDPLEAGLEIYAQPPGKKLSTLSLLSGGEQALTALSLIFAVFKCNPAPISVLDEVDAPLDDANVDRFCSLLEDMVRDTGTRFLVVTHHHLTMARMDRLYGVTMQERGVSRLLSVDFHRAVEMVDPSPKMAAE